MALTTGRYQTCPTAPTPSGYLLISFLNHTEQAIATGLQTADKELQGLVWAGGWGCARVWLAQLSFVSTLCCAFIPFCPLRASSFLGVPCSGQMGRVRRPRGDSLYQSHQGWWLSRTLSRLRLGRAAPTWENHPFPTSRGPSMRPESTLACMAW